MPIMTPTAAVPRKSGSEWSAKRPAKQANRLPRHVRCGHILLVQEGRFRLLADGGQGLLLTLAHNANVDAADLQRFQRERSQIEVHYTGEPNLVSGVAHEIRVLSGER